MGIKHKFLVHPKVRQGRWHTVFITTELAKAQYRTKLSDQKAVFIVSETKKCLGYDIKEVSLNRSTIYRKELLVDINNHRN